MPGDTVQIGDGIYREWVSPRNGGWGTISASSTAMPPAHTRSSAELRCWAAGSTGRAGVWRAQADNALFGSYNPYADEIFGDWYDGLGQTHHTGEVFWNGTALYEAASLQALLDPPAAPQQTMRWFAKAEAEHTVFYADFGGGDPPAPVSRSACGRSAFSRGRPGWGI